MTQSGNANSPPSVDDRGRRSLLAACRDGLFDVTTQQRRRRAGNPLPSRIFDWVIDLSAFAGAIIVLFVAFTIGFNVLMRRVFEAPVPWALPMTEFSLLYLTFLAAPIVLRREGHVRMTAITEQLGPLPRLWLYIIGSLTGAGVCAILVWRTLDKTLQEFESNAVLLSGIEVERWLITWVIPYGFTVLGIQFLRMAVNAIRFKRYQSVVEEAGV